MNWIWDGVAVMPFWVPDSASRTARFVSSSILSSAVEAEVEVRVALLPKRAGVHLLLEVVVVVLLVVVRMLTIAIGL